MIGQSVIFMSLHYLFSLNFMVKLAISYKGGIIPINLSYKLFDRINNFCTDSILWTFQKIVISLRPLPPLPTPPADRDTSY